MPTPLGEVIREIIDPQFTKGVENLYRLAISNQNSFVALSPGGTIYPAELSDSVYGPLPYLPILSPTGEVERVLFATDF